MNTTYHLLIYAACYSIFFIHTMVSNKNRSNRLFDNKGRLASNQSSLTELYSVGIMWLALVPIAMLKHSSGLRYVPAAAPTTLQLFTLLLLLILFIVTGMRLGRQVILNDKYDQLLSRSFLGYYFPLRVVFLCAYELFFRGYLFFDCTAWFGFLLAMIISTALTILIHVFNNKKEMWACIPFGLILCSCNYWFQAVWPAVIMHIALCMSYEITFVHQFFSKLKPVK